MKKYVATIMMAVLLTSMLTSCSKEKLQQQEVQQAYAIMTNGSWLVTKYIAGTSNQTSSFTGWECRFNTDKTTVATNGATIVAGTWSASITNQTITATFPAGSGVLEKINGTWKNIRSNTTTAEFSQNIAGVDCMLELTQK